MMSNILRRAILTTAFMGIAGAAAVPVFEVDPSWPKVPAKWKLGDASSIAVDAQDNVWSIHRPNTVEANFKAADIKAADAVDDEARPGAPKAVSGAGDMIGACCKVAPSGAW